MSYGFRVLTGSGATLALASEDEAPGVIVDYFYFDRTTQTSITKNYSNFSGSNLLVIINAANTSSTHGLSASTYGNSVTITAISGGVLAGSAWVTVLGV